MAILPDVPGIEVVVRMNGVIMKEYPDDDVEVNEGELGQFQAKRTVSKYIESISDEVFAIYLGVHRPFNFNCEALNFEVYVDGKKARSPLLKKSDYLHTGEWKRLIEGIKSFDTHGGWKLQKFQFAAIETTMDNDKMYEVKTDAARMKEMGEIAVWVYRKSEVQKAGLMGNRDNFGLNQDAVHEKALEGQAKSHGTALGEVMDSKASNKYMGKKVDGEGRPIAIYKFKYRSEDALRSLLIIPCDPYDRPSAPTPNSASRRYATMASTRTTPDPDENISTTTPEDKALMAAYLDGLRDQGSPLVRREHGISASAGFRKTKQAQAAVVDLAED